MSLYLLFIYYVRKYLCFLLLEVTERKTPYWHRSAGYPSVRTILRNKTVLKKWSGHFFPKITWGIMSILRDSIPLFFQGWSTYLNCLFIFHSCKIYFSFILNLVTTTILYLTRFIFDYFEITKHILGAFSSRSPKLKLKALSSDALSVPYPGVRDGTIGRRY